MKILATTPVSDHLGIYLKAVDSYGCDTFVVSNNKDLPIEADIVNDPSLYCNGAWNQAMEYFLKGDWTHLALGTSDVIMQSDWKKFIPRRKNEVWIPTYIESLDNLGYVIGKRELLEYGVAGAFTILPRAAVEIVYPIPEQLKLWFGDQYMYEKLRKHGWKVMQYKGVAYHYGSISIMSNQHEALNIIEADKVAWSELPEDVFK